MIELTSEERATDEVLVPPFPSPLRRHENPNLFNAKIQTLSGFELWITPYNRMFLVNEKTGGLGYPSLNSKHELGFEPYLSGIPLEVATLVIGLLEKQAQVRRRMVEAGEYEDDNAWNWS